MRNREAAAYHEAGHFVAKAVLMPDVWCLRVTIVPGGSVLGESEGLEDCRTGVTPSLHQVLPIATVLFAGGAAELRHTRDRNSAELRSLDDVREARQLLRTVEHGGAKVAIMEEQSRACADEILAQHWDDVEVIARALLQHETLDGEEAEGMIAGASRAVTDHQAVLEQFRMHGREKAAPRPVNHRWARRG